MRWRFHARVIAHWTAAATAAVLALPAQAAEAYPCQVLRIVSPYPAGGTTDILARLVAPELAKRLEVTVIVENKGGASGNIGTEMVVRAPADGCTALLGNNTGIVINRNLYKLKYDPTKDLQAISLVASTPLFLYVHADVPARTPGELAELIRKTPGKYSFASAGSGSPQHLLGELFKLQKQVDMVHVPYRGSGPALQDVLGGAVPISFEASSVLAPHAGSPRIRLLAITSEQRSPKFPNVPTMAESGFKDFVFENWYGLFVPAKTPRPLVQRLSQALQEVLRSPEVMGKLGELGSRDVSASAADTSRFIANEVPQWETIVKKSGATVD